VEQKEEDEKKFGLAFAFQQGKEFAMHVALYIAVMAIFSLFFDIRDVKEMNSGKIQKIFSSFD